MKEYLFITILVLFTLLFYFSFYKNKKNEQENFDDSCNTDNPEYSFTCLDGSGTNDKSLRVNELGEFEGDINSVYPCITDGDLTKLVPILWQACNNLHGRTITLHKSCCDMEEKLANLESSCSSDN